MEELPFLVRVKDEGKRTRPGHVQVPELLHLRGRLIAVNGHRHKGLVEAGLDCLVRNGALDQGAARGSSSPAVLNELKM